MLKLQYMRFGVLSHPARACVGHAWRFMTSQPSQRFALERCWWVSSHGRVCNSMGVISFGCRSPCGYHKVQICRTMFNVHRLVAFAFLGPPPTEQAWQVHHRDGNGSNNCLENLEYVTPSQNIFHSHTSLSRRCSGAKQSQPVMWRAVGSQSWTISSSMTQAASELGMSRSSVSRGCRAGKAVKGLEFRLADDAATEALPGEKWRQMYDPISGLEVPGRMVSSLGRIRMCNGRISKGHLRKSGYYFFRISSVSRTQLVHRLVAFSFLGPPVSQQRSQVNHKDLDKGNNAVDNLEYVTASENATHRFTQGSNPRSKCGRPVGSRSFVSTDAWTWHPSINSAANTLGVSSYFILRCVTGHAEQSAGFEFRLHPSQTSYDDEEWRKVDIEALLQERALRHCL